MSEPYRSEASGVWTGLMRRTEALKLLRQKLDYAEQAGMPLFVTPSWCAERGLVVKHLSQTLDCGVGMSADKSRVVLVPKRFFRAGRDG